MRRVKQFEDDQGFILKLLQAPAEAAFAAALTVKRPVRSTFYVRKKKKDVSPHISFLTFPPHMCWILLKLKRNFCQRADRNVLLCSPEQLTSYQTEPLEHGG